MGVFDPRSNTPELFVPDLSRPAGAAVDADGNVACITCGTRLPAAQADIVGQGYRCAPCSARAQIEALAYGRGDAAANLSQHDRANLSASGKQLIVVGIAAMIGGAALLAIGLPRSGGFVFVGGAASCSVGFARVRAAR